jgi:hypothetical protein
MRNLLQRVPKHAYAMVAALVRRTIFAQPDHDAAQRQLAAFPGTLGTPGHPWNPRASLGSHLSEPLTIEHLFV